MLIQSRKITSLQITYTNKPRNITRLAILPRDLHMELPGAHSTGIIIIPTVALPCEVGLVDSCSVLQKADSVQKNDQPADYVCPHTRNILLPVNHRTLYQCTGSQSCSKF